jgi:hypothetical protein
MKDTISYDPDAKQWCFVLNDGFNTICGYRDTEEEARTAMQEYSDPEEWNAQFPQKIKLGRQGLLDVWERPQ